MMLALDFTLPGFAWALIPQKGQPFVAVSQQARGSEFFHAQLQEHLQSQHLNPADITTIAVTVGPGSFTGSRIGLAIAEAFKLANAKIQIIGLSTLQALALAVVQTHKPSQPFTVLLDAAGGSVYHQTFAPDATAQNQPACTLLTELNIQTPVAAHVAHLLPQSAQFTFTHIDPLILAEMSKTPTSHLPAQPLYLKELNYRKVDHS